MKVVNSKRDQLMKLTFKLNTDTPDYSNTTQQISQSKVILIRHAKSLQNQRVETLYNSTSPTTFGQWLDVQSDPALVDTELSNQGIQQCIDASRHLLGTQFHTIFLSPLKRTIQTAYYLFRDHQCFKDMKFIVHPLLREKLHVSADIPGLNLHSVINEHKPLFGQHNLLLHQKYQDFAKNEGDKWYLQHFNEDEKQEILKIAKDENVSAQQSTVKRIESIYPKSIENIDSTYKRGLQFKEDTQEYIQNFVPLDEDKIGIIGHHLFFRVYMAQQDFWLRNPLKDKLPDHPDTVNLRNCEFYPDHNFKIKEMREKEL